MHLIRLFVFPLETACLSLCSHESWAYRFKLEFKGSAANVLRCQKCFVCPVGSYVLLCYFGAVFLRRSAHDLMHLFHV
jgi:hypothetical protein